MVGNASIDTKMFMLSLLKILIGAELHMCTPMGVVSICGVCERIGLDIVSGGRGVLFQIDLTLRRKKSLKHELAWPPITHETIGQNVLDLHFNF